ncbi:hypothetical protein ACWDZ8_44460, partial [Streptomyces sp. NPDC003233]
MRAHTTRMKRVAIAVCSAPILAIVAGAGAAQAATSSAPASAPAHVATYHGDGWGWGWGDDGGWGWGWGWLTARTCGVAAQRTGHVRRKPVGREIG